MKRARGVRVAILYTPRERTPYREFISKEQIAASTAALSTHGYDVTVVPFSPRRGYRQLKESRADVILNLAYGWTNPRSGSRYSQADVAEIAEQTGAAIVGASSRAQRTAQDKLATGELARACGVLTPAHIDPKSGKLPRRAVLKPRFGACHRDVRLVDARQLGPIDRRSWVLQEYVDGDEYTVGLLCMNGRLKTLPPVAIEFDSRFAVMDWNRYPWRLRVRPDQTSVFSDVARLLFATFRMRDYARFDFRLTDRGPVLLDANALPNIDPAVSLLPRAAREAGVSYPRLIRGLVKSALLRGSSDGP